MKKILKILFIPLLVFVCSITLCNKISANAEDINLSGAKLVDDNFKDVNSVHIDQRLYIIYNFGKVNAGDSLKINIPKNFKVDNTSSFNIENEKDRSKIIANANFDASNSRSLTVTFNNGVDGGSFHVPVTLDSQPENDGNSSRLHWDTDGKLNSSIVINHGFPTTDERLAKWAYPFTENGSKYLHWRVRINYAADIDSSQVLNNAVYKDTPGSDQFVDTNSVKVSQITYKGTDGTDFRYVSNDRDANIPISDIPNDLKYPYTKLSNYNNGFKINFNNSLNCAVMIDYDSKIIDPNSKEHDNHGSLTSSNVRTQNIDEHYIDERGSDGSASISENSSPEENPVPQNPQNPQNQNSRTSGTGDSSTNSGKTDPSGSKTTPSGGDNTNSSGSKVTPSEGDKIKPGTNNSEVMPTSNENLPSDKFVNPVSSNSSNSNNQSSVDNNDNKNSNYNSNNLIKKNTIVYPTKSMNLYKGTYFSKNNLLRHYTNKPMINKPIFVVDGYGKSKTGLLRYKIHEMNHKNRIGYITVRNDYVLPVYATQTNGLVTVISAGGVNSYQNKNLTNKVAHYRQGSQLKVKGIVWNNRSTRYVLTNGNFITADKTLALSDSIKQVKSFTANKGLSIYKDIQLTHKLKTLKKSQVMKIKNWDYSDKENTLKYGSLRYRVAGGYVYAKSKLITNVK